MSSGRNPSYNLPHNARRWLSETVSYRGESCLFGALIGWGGIVHGARGDVGLSAPERSCTPERQELETDGTAGLDDRPNEGRGT